MSDRTFDELDRFWNAYVSGAQTVQSALDPAIAEAVDRFQRAQDVNGIDPELVGRLWSELMRTQRSSAYPLDPDVQTWDNPMNLATLAGEFSPAQSMAEPSRRNRRVLSRLILADSIPKSKPAIPQHAGRRGLAYRAIATVVVLALVFGYFAFDPFRSDPDDPLSIPGAVAPAGTPEQVVTGTPFPLTGHPIIGIWLVEYNVQRPGADIKVDSFGEDGKYSNFNNHRLPRVTMGEWRATGERTLELVCVEQMIHLHDLWDPESETIPYVLDAKVQFWRLSITVDETGNSFTGTGGYIYYDGEGSVLWTVEDFQVIGTRMEAVPMGTDGTPPP